jgi:hypothetical protein
VSPPVDLRAWLGRELDHLEAANARATPGLWQPRDLESVVDLGVVEPDDLELAALARNLMPGLVQYGRNLLERHKPCQDHGGCTACGTCDSPDRVACTPLRRFATVFHHRGGYRLIEWMV